MASIHMVQLENITTIGSKLIFSKNFIDWLSYKIVFLVIIE